MGLTPDFARPIVAARASGKRPASMVIVSDGDHGLHRRFPDNPVVRVRPEQRPGSFDWRFLADLDVEIATEDIDRGVALAYAIDRVQPSYLRVWNLSNDAMMRVRWLGMRSIVRESEWLCA